MKEEKRADIKQREEQAPAGTQDNKARPSSSSPVQEKRYKEELEEVTPRGRESTIQPQSTGNASSPINYNGVGHRLQNITLGILIAPPLMGAAVVDFTVHILKNFWRGNLPRENFLRIGRYTKWICTAFRGIELWDKFTGYENGNAMDRHERAQHTTQQLHRLHEDKLHRNEEIKVGARGLDISILPAKHELILRKDGFIVEMGFGEDGAIAVFQYHPDDYPDPDEWFRLAPAQVLTLRALQHGKVSWSEPTRVDPAALDGFIKEYEGIWEGVMYAMGTYNSNYFVHMMVIGSGGVIRGLRNLRPKSPVSWLRIRRIMNELLVIRRTNSELSRQDLFEEPLEEKDRSAERRPSDEQQKNQASSEVQEGRYQRH